MNRGMVEIRATLRESSAWQNIKDGMTIEEQIERLTGIVNALPGTVVAHDNQIEALIEISEKNARNWENLERQWQAYLNTLPRH